MLGLLLEQAPVDDVTDVGRAEVDAELRGKRSSRLGERDAGGVVELLLARGEEPDAALEPRAQVGDEALDLEHAIFVVVYVLAHLVDDEEESAPRRALREHALDGADAVDDGRGLIALSEALRVEPARGLEVALAVERVHRVGENACRRGESP